jgi:hypothetical protein
MKVLENIEGFRSLNVESELQIIINFSEKIKKQKKVFLLPQIKRN